jgi:hypothetical protein
MRGIRSKIILILNRNFSLLKRFERRITNAHDSYIRFVCSHPIVLIPLAVGYVLLALFYFALCVVAIIPFSSRPDVLIAIVAFCYTIFAVALASHYAYITVLSFLSATSFKGLFGPVLQVVQLVATTVFFFAVIHYYILLFTDGVAYYNLTLPEQHFRGPLDRLIFPPPIKTVLDCIYFSTVTMATVGYGDIYPISFPAKVATIGEIFFSFGLIVVVLGWVIGHAEDHESSAPRRLGPAVPGEDPLQRWKWRKFAKPSRAVKPPIKRRSPERMRISASRADSPARARAMRR